MKKLIFILALITLTAAGPGCSSFSRNTYVASGITHVTARTALKGWNAYLAKEYSGASTARTSELIAQEKQVRDAYQKYQDAQILVLTVAQDLGKLQPNDPNTPVVSDRLSVAISSSSVALAALVSLVEKFGVKIN